MLTCRRGDSAHASDWTRPVRRRTGHGQGRAEGPRYRAGTRGVGSIKCCLSSWRGDINGRRPRLTHAKALILQATIWDQRAYDTGLRDAMRLVIDRYTLMYPGIRRVEHEFFYAVHGADDATRHGYLQRAYELGRQF
jgi:putative NADPH-quinone reductase